MLLHFSVESLSPHILLIKLLDGTICGRRGTGSPEAGVSERGWLSPVPLYYHISFIFFIMELLSLSAECSHPLHYPIVSSA